MLRPINISDKQGNPLPYAKQLLDALAYFPDDADSFEMCRFIIEKEYLRLQQIGREDYKLTKVTDVLFKAASKRAQQVHVCGLVALAMIGLRSQDKLHSQEAAIGAVSELTGEANKFPFIFWDEGKNGYVVELKAVTSDESSIRKIFVKYRNTAHICAARISSSDYLEPLPPFEPSPEADACHIATVLEYQNIFHQAMSTEHWNLRLIASPKGLAADTPLLEPTESLMEAILKG